MEQFLPAEESIETEIDRKVLADAISNFLLMQSKEKRIIFMRRYFEFETVSSISKNMRCKESRVYTLLHRMRQDLRKYLKKEEVI